MKTVCSVIGCNDQVRCVGLCKTHYQRKRVTGNIHRTWKSKDAHDGERLLARLDFPESGCWIWQGNKTRYGYSKVYSNGVPTYGHRVSYELFKGPIPAGYVIDHLCRVTSCVNPDHLEAVTNSENALRAAPYNATRDRSASRKCRNGHVRTPENTRMTAQGALCVICYAAKVERRKRKRSSLLRDAA